VVLAAVQQNGYALEYAADPLKADKEVALAAVSKNGLALRYASKPDNEVVLVAVQNDEEDSDGGSSSDSDSDSEIDEEEYDFGRRGGLRGDALRFVNNDADLWSDKDFVLAVVELRGHALNFVNKEADFWSDKDFVLAILKLNGGAIKNVDKDADFWSDKDFVLAIMKLTFRRRSGRFAPMVCLREDALRNASDDLKNDTDVVFAFCCAMGVLGLNSGMTVKDLMLAAVHKDGNIFRCASNDLKNDKDVVFAFCRAKGVPRVNNGMTIKHLWLAAVHQDGMCLEYAHESLQRDREVVLAAVQQNGAALKFADDGSRLNQDPELLKASGLWDQDENKRYLRKEKAIQSVKFSLAQKSSTYATDFALAMREDPFLKEFQTYNPNAWSKESCDPDLTNIRHPCRGLATTCQNLLPNMTAKGKPCDTSCWRFAFRFHQQVSKDTGGFMIQVDEFEGLGSGQRIETSMAEEVGLKIFRTFTGLPNKSENKPNAKALQKLAKSH